MKLKIDQHQPLFFTSDLHFYHNNIIKYSNRPFKDVSEMHDEIVDRWNKKISKDSTVFILGDFSFSSQENSIRLFKMLNGKKHLIVGNHDKFLDRHYWISVNDVVETSYNGIQFFLSHYSHKVWNKSHYGTIHLYGHSHGSLPDDPTSLSMDIGVDCSKDFTPFSFEEIVDIMKTKTFIPKDHHR